MGTFRICKRRFLLRTCYPYRQVSKTSNQMTYDNKVHIITLLWVLDSFFTEKAFFTTLGGFICISPSWLSVTSSSCQCCWTRMTSQMIECYQFRCHFVESHEMACYLKWETYSGPISFEVQWNDIWTDNIQSFEMPF